MKAESPVASATFACLAVVAAAACCGIPVLLSMGAGLTIAGLGLRSWVLALAGAVTLVVVGLRLRRRRADVVAPPCDQEPLASADDHGRSR